MALKVGEAAPAFALASTSGGEVKLAEQQGKKVVLYFYPRDLTPGCTQEAKDFQTNLEALQKAGAVVYGVSKDTLAMHQKFQAKEKLKFALLSDPDNAVAKAYGVYAMKKLYGKESLGTIRSTFLIGADGKLEQVWSPVKVKGHADAVLSAVTGTAPAPAGAAPKKAPASKKPPAQKPPAQKPAAQPAKKKPAKK